jgi:stalled ribosome rescue protein Dom34
MRQTAIWIDHDEARVFQVEGAAFDEQTVHAHTHQVHRHPKSQETKTRNHPQGETRFFDDVLAAVEGSEGLLLMGPSVTKLHLLRYAQEHSPALAARVVGVETADHPTDRQVAAHVRHYFHSDSPRRGLAP